MDATPTNPVAITDPHGTVVTVIYIGSADTSTNPIQVPAGLHVVPGWTWDGATFHAPVPTPGT